MRQSQKLPSLFRLWFIALNHVSILSKCYPFRGYWIFCVFGQKWRKKLITTLLFLRFFNKASFLLLLKISSSDGLESLKCRQRDWVISINEDDWVKNPRNCFYFLIQDRQNNSRTHSPLKQNDNIYNIGLWQNQSSLTS